MFLLSSEIQEEERITTGRFDSLHVSFAPSISHVFLILTRESGRFPPYLLILKCNMTVHVQRFRNLCKYFVFSMNYEELRLICLHYERREVYSLFDLLMFPSFERLCFMRGLLCA
ncbi:unnamed protein product [Brassica oleracea]